MLYKGEAARDLHETSFDRTVSQQYEARPLLGEPASHARNKAEEQRENEGSAEGGNEGSDIGSNDKSDEGDIGSNGNFVHRVAASDDASRIEPPDSGKIVYLTFDDGPSKHTPEVLDILKREGVAATFFVLGEHVERNPELTSRIVEEGHAIGNHTYNHQYDKLYGGFGEYGDQVMKTDDIIYEATGVRTTLMRAPGGTYRNFDRGYFDALLEAGYQVHDWNVDSGDSKRRGVPAAEIIANVKSSKLADTLNVLLHDSAGHEESVKALPAIIQYYKELGYSFKALDSSVEPMQFQLATKLKWSRGAVAKEESAKLVSFGKALDDKAERRLTRQGGLALIVHRGDQSLILREDQYSLISDSIHVPLRELTEWMGGRTELDEESGVIEASLMGKQLFWLADSRKTSSAGENDFIDVPLRATLAEFGFGISDYIYTKDRREVWISE